MKTSHPQDQHMNSPLSSSSQLFLKNTVAPTSPSATRQHVASLSCQEPNYKPSVAAPTSAPPSSMHPTLPPVAVLSSHATNSLTPPADDLSLTPSSQAPSYTGLLPSSSSPSLSITRPTPCKSDDTPKSPTHPPLPSSTSASSSTLSTSLPPLKNLPQKTSARSLETTSQAPAHTPLPATVPITSNMLEEGEIEQSIPKNYTEEEIGWLVAMVKIHRGNKIPWGFIADKMEEVADYTFIFPRTANSLKARYYRNTELLSIAANKTYKDTIDKHSTKLSSIHSNIISHIASNLTEMAADSSTKYSKITKLHSSTFEKFTQEFSNVVQKHVDTYSSLSNSYGDKQVYLATEKRKREEEDIPAQKRIHIKEPKFCEDIIFVIPSDPFERKITVTLVASLVCALHRELYEGKDRDVEATRRVMFTYLDLNITRVRNYNDILEKSELVQKWMRQMTSRYNGKRPGDLVKLFRNLSSHKIYGCDSDNLVEEFNTLFPYFIPCCYQVTEAMNAAAAHEESLKKCLKKKAPNKCNESGVPHVSAPSSTLSVSSSSSTPIPSTPISSTPSAPSTTTTITSNASANGNVPGVPSLPLVPASPVLATGQPLEVVPLRVCVKTATKSVNVAIKFQGETPEQLTESVLEQLRRKKAIQNSDEPISWLVMSCGITEWQDGLLLDEDSIQLCKTPFSKILVEF